MIAVWYVGADGSMSLTRPIAALRLAKVKSAWFGHECPFFAVSSKARNLTGVFKPNCFDAAPLSGHNAGMRRLLAAAIGIGLGVLAPQGDALAQGGVTDAPIVAPLSNTSIPQNRLEQQRLLDSLFLQLSDAKNPDAAKLIEQAIWRLWLVSGSDTVDFLMGRVLEAMRGDDYPLALDLLNAVVALAPDYAEGWNKRATVLFALKDYPRALRDVERTLALEPRHFGALSGMGLIFNDIGDQARALSAFRRALAVNPFMSDAKSLVRELEEAVDGREI